MPRPGSQLAATLTRIGMGSLCALVLAACAGTHVSRATRAQAGHAGRPTHDTHLVYIYSSLPERGPDASASRQIEAGIELALQRSGHRAGSYRVRYERLSDATRHGDGSNAGQTVLNAERAAHNPQAVAYIGELSSAATELSLPIVNQAGIVQLSPGSGYPGLTEKVPGGVTTASEPDRYYPHARNFVRLIPSDLVAVAAALDVLRLAHCGRVAAAAFGGGQEAGSMITALKLTAPHYGITYESVPAPGNRPPLYQSYAAALRTHYGVDCFVLTGRLTPAAVALTTQLHEQLPVGAAILGMSGFCTARWSDQSRGGVAASVATALYCTTPLLPVGQYVGSPRFVAAYRAVHHRAPPSYAFYGYEATELVLTVLRDLGVPNVDPRRQVLQNIMDDVASAELGTEGFDSQDGDLATSIYGVDRIGRRFAPVHYRSVSPPYVLPSEP